MNDLQTVAFVQLGRVPLRARHDFAVQFDGHAVSLHPKLLDELRQRGGFDTGFRFAIHQ